MPLPKLRRYTIDDIYNLPEGTRAELIDGELYDMAPPSRKHQGILHFLDCTIGSYLSDHHGICKIYPAPFAVFLQADDDTAYVEPDISVICDLSKLSDKGCHGAPDWTIEIISPSSRQRDFYKKLSLYQSAGVREYWIVDPDKEIIVVYDLENQAPPVLYGFTDQVKAGIYNDFKIDFSKLEL